MDPRGRPAQPRSKTNGKATARGARSRVLAIGRVRIPRVVVWSVAGVIGAVALSMFIDAAVYANKIHGGVTIAGQDVAGMTDVEAAATLTAGLDQAGSRSVDLVSSAKTWKVTPEALGLQIDLDATVSAALGATRDNNLISDQAHKLTLYFSGRDIALVATLDQTKLDALVSEVAKAVDQSAVNASVTVADGKIKEVPAEDGLVVDQATLAARLVGALCQLESSSLDVPVTVAKPELDGQVNAAALAQAKTMLSGPVTITSYDQSWSFAPGQIEQWIDYEPQDIGGVSTSMPYVSAEKMASTFTSMTKQMSTAPIDAHFEHDDTKAWVVPAVPGRVLKPEETAAAIDAAVLKTTGRETEVVAELTQPEFTTEEAEAMGIKDLLSERTTEFTGTKNRQNNVRVATAAIDGKGERYVAPGEEFSFIAAVGDRTEAAGYKEAPGIQANGSLDGELGGGICQVATTLFNSAFFAGLKVTERRNHSLYISHYPEGRDAAITTDTDGTIDLRFVNDTGHHIWISGESDGITTTFRIFGTSDGREVTFRNSGRYNIGPTQPTWTYPDSSIPTGKTVVVSAGQPRMNVKVTRWITWPDGTKKEDVFLSTYYQRPRIVNVGTG